MSTTDKNERLSSAQIGGIVPISNEKELMSFSASVASAIQILDARTQVDDSLLDVEEEPLQDDTPVMSGGGGDVTASSNVDTSISDILSLDASSDGSEITVRVTAGNTKKDDISGLVGYKGSTLTMLNMPSGTVSRVFASMDSNSTEFIGTPFTNEILVGSGTTGGALLYANFYSGTNTAGGRYRSDIHALTSNGIVVINDGTCTTIDTAGQNGVIVFESGTVKFIRATSDSIFGFQNGTATFFDVKPTSSGDY